MMILAGTVLLAAGLWLVARTGGHPGRHRA